MIYPPISLYLSDALDNKILVQEYRDGKPIRLDCLPYSDSRRQHPTLNHIATYKPEGNKIDHSMQRHLKNIRHWLGS